MKYRNLLLLLIILCKNRIYLFKFTIKISLIVFALIWLMGEHLQDELSTQRRDLLDSMFRGADYIQTIDR